MPNVRLSDLPVAETLPGNYVICILNGSVVRVPVHAIDYSAEIYIPAPSERLTLMQACVLAESHALVIVPLASAGANFVKPSINNVSPTGINAFYRITRTQSAPDGVSFASFPIEFIPDPADTAFIPTRGIIDINNWSITWAAVHGHAVADITGLQPALNGKADADHPHVAADISDLQAALDARAPVSHTHAISEITDIDTLTTPLSIALISNTEYPDIAVPEQGA